ncbi:MAG: hypothetical protein ABIW82_09870 [Dokdonella sp.]
MSRSMFVQAALLSAVIAASSISAPAKAPAVARFSTDIAFEDCDGLICIEVALDGAKPRRMLFDTGNLNQVIVAEAAREAGWVLEPVQKDGQTVPGIYIAGEHRAAFGKVDAKASFFAFDRSRLGDYVPPGDGALTYPFFKDRVVQIDYPHHRLRISDVLTTPVPERGDGVASLKQITFGERGPLVLVGSPFTLNGKSLHAQIDTCYTGTMLIYDAAVANLGLTKQGKPEFFRYTDGGVPLLAASAQSLGLGAQIIAKSPTLYFVGDGKNPVHQPDGLFEATAGNALFAHSVVTLDFHAMTLEVTPEG